MWSTNGTLKYQVICRKINYKKVIKKQSQRQRYFYNYVDQRNFVTGYIMNTDWVLEYKIKQCKSINVILKPRKGYMQYCVCDCLVV